MLDFKSFFPIRLKPTVVIFIERLSKTRHEVTYRAEETGEGIAVALDMVDGRVLPGFIDRWLVTDGSLAVQRLHLDRCDHPHEVVPPLVISADPKVKDHHPDLLPPGYLPKPSQCFVVRKRIKDWIQGDGTSWNILDLSMKVVGGAAHVGELIDYSRISIRRRTGPVLFWVKMWGHWRSIERVQGPPPTPQDPRTTRTTAQLGEGLGAGRQDSRVLRRVDRPEESIEAHSLPVDGGLTIDTSNDSVQLQLSFDSEDGQITGLKLRSTRFTGINHVPIRELVLADEPVDLSLPHSVRDEATTSDGRQVELVATWVAAVPWASFDEVSPPPDVGLLHLTALSAGEVSELVLAASEDWGLVAMAERYPSGAVVQWNIDGLPQ